LSNINSEVRMRFVLGAAVHCNTTNKIVNWALANWRCESLNLQGCVGVLPVTFLALGGEVVKSTILIHVVLVDELGGWYVGTLGCAVLVSDGWLNWATGLGTFWGGTLFCAKVIWSVGLICWKTSVIEGYWTCFVISTILFILVRNHGSGPCFSLLGIKPLRLAHNHWVVRPLRIGVLPISHILPLVNGSTCHTKVFRSSLVECRVFDRWWNLVLNTTWVFSPGLQVKWLTELGWLFEVDELIRETVEDVGFSHFKFFVHWGFN